MTTYAVLEQIPLEIVPGSELTCGLTVRNNSDVVQAYQFEVVGDAAPWTVVEPAQLSVYPGTEATVSVSFQPPRSSRVVPGELPFAVRVLPSERPEDVVTPEGVLLVLPFTATTAEITPRTSTGRRRARHEVAVDNRGNVPIDVSLVGVEPDGKLTLRARPPVIMVAAGVTEFVPIAVRKRRWLWHGSPVTHPFQVVVEAEARTDPPLAAEPPIVLDAASVQTPVIPSGFRRLATALVALLLLLGGVWFLLLKPAVQSAAKQAVEKPLTKVAKEAGDAGKKADQAKETADKAETVANGGGAAPKPTPTKAAGAKVTTGPVTVQLRTFLPKSATPGTGTLRVKARTTLVITDLVLQNPQGDAGRVDVLVDNAAILTLSLANFRDLDYHFVSPIEVPAGKALALRTTCQKPGPPIDGTTAGQCRVWLFGSGTNRVTAPPAAGNENVSTTNG